MTAVEEAPETQSVCGLPRHLWCLIAQFDDVFALANVLRCSSRLLGGGDEVQALWGYHSFASGVARLASGPKSDWVWPYNSEVQVVRCIDWRALLFANRSHGGRPGAPPPIWVRVRDLDLRVPVVSEGASVRQEALMAAVAAIVRLDWAEEACPDGSARASSAGPGGCRPPMRLRRLEWGGRPGMVLAQGVQLAAGSQVLLEWASPKACVWPAPPRTAWELLGGACWHGSVSYFGYDFYGLWLRRFTPASLAAAPHRRRPALLRITSSVLRPATAAQELWIVIDLLGAFCDLCQDILWALRRDRPDVSSLWRPLRYQLMDARNPLKRNLSSTEATPLQELLWVESESIRVELQGCEDAPSLCAGAPEHSAAAPGAPGAGGQASRAGPGGQTLLLWREPGLVRDVRNAPGGSRDLESSRFHEADAREFAELRARPRRDTRARLWWRRDGEAFSRPAAAAPLARLVTEPVPSTTSLHRSASATDLGDLVALDWSARQLSESSELPQEQREWSRVVTEPPRHQPPGSAGAGMDFDAQAQQQQQEQQRHQSVPAIREDTEEELLPHQTPILLPGTEMARQFEFHPTLPEVMLTGDQRGGVSVISMEQRAAHQSLTVDEHPVVSLAWLKHAPGKAVCGIARTGMIRFLTYDWSAPLAQSALAEISSFQAFTQISSLSPNCGDTYLLASGLLHDFAVYDVRSGRLLCESSDAHDHFINVSRFSYGHPQMLATASLDRTCKLWDLRLPLTRAKCARTLDTGGPNVMCAFSPDDRLLLCSGIDKKLVQFDLQSCRRVSGVEFQLPRRGPAVALQQYRRSMYFASGQRLATAATDESHLQVLSTTGRSLGVIDLRGVILRQDVGCCARQSPAFASGVPHARAHRGQATEADFRGTEYVQSLRTHPSQEALLGAIMSVSQGELEPYRGIALVHLDRQVVKSES